MRTAVTPTVSTEQNAGTETVRFTGTGPKTAEGTGAEAATASREPAITAAAIEEAAANTGPEGLQEAYSGDLSDAVPKNIGVKEDIYHAK